MTNALNALKYELELADMKKINSSQVQNADKIAEIQPLEENGSKTIDSIISQLRTGDTEKVPDFLDEITDQLASLKLEEKSSRSPNSSDRTEGISSSADTFVSAEGLHIEQRKNEPTENKVEKVSESLTANKSTNTDEINKNDLLVQEIETLKIENQRLLSSGMHRLNLCGSTYQQNSHNGQTVGQCIPTTARIRTLIKNCKD